MKTYMTNHIDKKKEKIGLFTIDFTKKEKKTHFFSRLIDMCDG